MHSLADCPLRTYAYITTTNTYPHQILALDHAALNLFSNFCNNNNDNNNNSNCSSDEDSLTQHQQQHARIMDYLHGKDISHVLLPDQNSNLSTAYGNELDSHTLHSFIVAENILHECSNIISNKGSNSNRRTSSSLSCARPQRRLHGCIHSVSRTTLSSEISHVIKDQSHRPSSSQDQNDHNQVKHKQQKQHDIPYRIFVLKDVTQIYDLALAAQENVLQQQYQLRRSSRFMRPLSTPVCTFTSSLSSSSSSPSAISEAGTPSSTLASFGSLAPLSLVSDDTFAINTNVTYQKLYLKDRTHDWSETLHVNVHPTRSSSSSSSASSSSFSSTSSSTSTSTSTSLSSVQSYCSSSSPSSSSSCSLSSTPTSASYTDSTMPFEHQKAHHQTQQDAGLLMLHVTRFGTVDHAFVIHQHQTQPQHQQQQQQQQHSITYSHPPLSHDNVLSASALKAPTNTSILSCVHPDDLRALCQGLDRLCKSSSSSSLGTAPFTTTFRVRWRASDSYSNSIKASVGEKQAVVSRGGRQEIEEGKKDESVLLPLSGQDKNGFSRVIEFQGELYQEWVDPTTSAPDPARATKIWVRQPNKDEFDYIWVEIQGTHSKGQPMLVVRPLMMGEIQEMRMSALSMMSTYGTINQKPYVSSSSTLLSKSATSSSPPSSSSTNSTTYKAIEKDSKEWRKNQFKRLGQEETLRLPKQLNATSLTNLKMTTTAIGSSSTSSAVTSTSKQNNTRKLGHKPGSLSFSKLPSSTAFTTLLTTSPCQQHPSYSNSYFHEPDPSSSNNNTAINKIDKNNNINAIDECGGEVMAANVSTMLAYSSGSSTPWSIFMSIALDAWKQWIQTVDAGQSHFQAWWEYIVDLTIDQLIDGVSFGLVLLGVDGEQQLQPQQFYEEQDRQLHQKYLAKKQLL
ncbi:hypothetical protein BX616_003857, partial [Lobosporangium transversale]